MISLTTKHNSDFYRESGGKALFCQLNVDSVLVKPLSEESPFDIASIPKIAHGDQDQLVCATDRAISSDFGACHALIFCSPSRPIVLAHMSVNITPENIAKGWGLYLSERSFRYIDQKYIDMNKCFPEKEQVLCINLCHNTSNLRGMAFTDEMITSGLACENFNRVITRELDHPNLVNRKIIVDARQEKIFVFPTNGDEYLEISLQSLLINS